MRKKLFSTTIIILLLAVTLFSVQTGAVVSPYVAVFPSSTKNPSLTPGSNYTISIKTDYAGNDITGWQFTLSYNASVLYGVKVTNGDLITKDKDPLAMFLPGTFDNTAGTLSLTGAFFPFIYPPAPLTSGPGTLANVTFIVKDTGASNIILGPETTLFGYTEGGFGEKYKIVDGYVQPDHLGHGYFDNTVPPPEFVPPVAVITAPEIAYVNEPIEFSGENSYDPDEGLIISYRWEFGDGTPPVQTTIPTIIHNYTTTGIYLVTLVVTDEENQMSEPAQHSIEIMIRPLASLVKWKAKPEAHHWIWSKDQDKNVSLTALAGNLAETPVDIEVIFSILDTRGGMPAGPDIVVTKTLDVSSADVPITVELNPFDYGYSGTKKVFYAHVTLKYYDPIIGTYVPTTSKIVKFAVVP